MAKWKVIEGFPGYEVSSAGDIRGKRGRLLKPGGERPIVILYIAAKPHARQVSHLVLEAFVSPRPDERSCALHWNDNPWDNLVANLRWGTRKDNKADERRNRGKYSGVPRKLAQVVTAALYSGSARTVARAHGTSHSVVIRERAVRHGR